MAKQIAERGSRLKIFWLKKNGYLNGGLRYGGIKWTYEMSGNESSINFTITTNGGVGDNIRLQYTHTSRGTGEKENIDYKVGLTTTLCNYGDKRYWFICPLTKNGHHCGRRVGVLFSIDKWFGCRHCGEIAYASQMQGGRYKGFVSVPDIEMAEKEVKRWHYRGQPTRKYRKVIRLNERFDNSFMIMAAKFDKRLGQFATGLK